MKIQKASLLKKVSVVVLAGLMAASSLSLVACKTRDDGTGNKPVDKSKTQLNIGVYNGGLGYAWVRDVATSFEEYYAETVFETGKKGVQVNIDPQKDNFNTGVLKPNLQAGTIAGNDVYYTASTYTDYLDSGVVLDVTDALTEKVYDDSGNLAENKATATKSIMDKMDPFFVENYKHTDNKYYGWPFEDSLGGIIYDADLFAEKGWEEPETMADFADLLETMLSYNITPFTVNGNAPFYYTKLTTAAVVQYEGVEGANMNLTYSGTYSGNSNIDSDGNVTVDGKKVQVGNADFHGGYAEVEITPENAYLLADQQGKYEALKFLELITKRKEYYTLNSYLSSNTHLLAQAEFIYSTQYEEAGISNRIAMIIDGDWWENEARNEFNTMGSGADAGRYGYGVRDFRFLPFPAMEGQKTNQRVVVSASNGKIAFINKATAVPEVAKLWLQFQHQDTALSTFTGETGSTLPYDYELSATDEARMTKFARSVWDVRHDPNVIVYHVPFKKHTMYETTNVKGGMALSGVGEEIRSHYADDYNAYVLKVLTLYRDNGITAEDIFKSSLNHYSQANWNKAYQTYLRDYGN